MTAPRVSIGLPVYNGERFVAETIESILAQTFADFELVISDNASTDATADMCRQYAEHDRRIIYNRHHQNIGGAANFNYVFHLAAPEAEYFRWHAHDDVIDPDYLAACVDALDRHPGFVVAQTMVRRIDHEGTVIEVVRPFGKELESLDPIARFAARASTHRCYEVFGLIRKSALENSELHGPYIGMDRVLLLELALRGRFALVPRLLFGNREHAERASKVTRRRSRRDLTAVYGGPSAPAFSSWAYLAAGVRVIRRNVPDARDQARCYWHLARAMRRGHVWAFLLLDPLERATPGLYDAMMRRRKALEPR
jgi:glycosyltransferase involved in cell wall biosynthesis